MQKFIDLLKGRLLEINEKTKRCKRCLMDETAKDIEFSKIGCNYCNDFMQILHNPPRKINLSLDELVQQIKENGKNRSYDCIVGISGGVDSAYTLVKVKELGLRPLAVHMDNGWNSELAANNIKNLVEKLGVDLYTHVINWQEYKALMEAFFDADVIDIELLYDNAMLAVNYEQANKYGIRYILAGSNTSTEGMQMPKNWNWFKLDKKNIRNIAKLNDTKMKTFPSIGTIEFVWNEKMKRVKWVSFLDYLEDYNKFEVLKILQKNFGYKPYPYKHYESIFTRFYQGFILPVKFGVDKRKHHLSTLVLSGQLLKKEALTQLENIPYLNEKELIEDIEYFLKKMGWSTEKFIDYLKRSEKSHLKYGSEIDLWNLLHNIYKKILKK